MNGLYVASITPYKHDGTFNPAMFETLTKRHLSQGASGFFVGGSSGECFLLSEQERIAVFEAACTFKNETNIIAHVGAISTEESIRYAKAAKSLGAQFIAATPPFYYGFTGAQIAQYFYDIVAAVDMPIMVYNFPTNTGKSFDLSHPDIRNLFCSNAVWGIKHTNLDLFQFERIRALNPKLVMMNGYDETMAAGLAFGADGSVGSSFNVLLPHFIKVYNAYTSGDSKTALTLQTKANNIMETLYSVGLVAAIKYILISQGIDVGEPRKPFIPLTDKQKKQVDKILADNLNL